jgi:hypothetical protein
MRHVVGTRTYHVSLAQKFVNVFCDDCHLIASTDSETGKIKIGYALVSDGFPYLQNRHPIFFRLVGLDRIKDANESGKYLTLAIEGEGEPWHFKFYEKDLFNKWV